MCIDSMSLLFSLEKKLTHFVWFLKMKNKEIVLFKSHFELAFTDQRVDLVSLGFFYIIIFLLFILSLCCLARLRR